MGVAIKTAWGPTRIADDHGIVGPWEFPTSHGTPRWMVDMENSIYNWIINPYGGIQNRWFI